MADGGSANNLSLEDTGSTFFFEAEGMAFGRVKVFEFQKKSGATQGYLKNPF